MFQKDSYDAVVIGSGPNGLSAAIALAQAGCRVLVVEAKDSIGGGVRSQELTLPGFVHDTCAAIVPLTLASPFFNSLPLEQHGLRWGFSPTQLVHPLDGGRAVVVKRSLDETAAGLGVDEKAYHSLYAPMLEHWKDFSRDLLGPLPLPPRNIITFLQFGLRALLPATFMMKRRFRSEEARAMMMGMAAHSMLALNEIATAAYSLVISLTAHAVGWPFPIGGAQAISDALGSVFRSLGGEMVCGFEVKSLDELPQAKAYLFDVTPRQLLRIVGERFPAGYRRQLERYRYGVGVFKVDYALDGPVPWAAEAAMHSATLHLGGTMDEIAEAETMTVHGKHPERPYMIVAQPSLFDKSRAPEGKHTLWAYCHVPHGSTFDMTERLDAQIERFAPGFKQRVLKRAVRGPAAMEAYNANYIGGDINGGVQDLFQLYTRPALRWDPYSTPLENVFICSSSTPPGGGVHGMSGFYAAKSALKKALGG